MEKWDRIVIRNGNPVMLGANKNEEGMNFAAEVLPGAPTMCLSRMLLRSCTGT